MFDTSDLLSSNCSINYLTKHIPKIQSIAREHNTHLLLVGNFTDQIHNFDFNRQENRNKIRPLMVNALDDARIAFNDVIFGNMSTKENAIDLVKQINSKLK